MLQDSASTEIQAVFLKRGVKKVKKPVVEKKTGGVMDISDDDDLELTAPKVGQKRESPNILEAPASKRLKTD
jgi:hypothetical protein